MTTKSPFRPTSASRLGAIEENGGMHPDQDLSNTASSSSRGQPRKSRLFPFDLPRIHHDREPPPYSEWDGLAPGESLAAMREKGSKPNSGRWKWIFFITIIAILLLVGLVVGLVVGLQQRRDMNDINDNNTPSVPSEDIQQFPAGSYSFVTQLSSTETSCTSNPSTWQCYPYNTDSTATFNWIISSANPTSPFSASPPYHISSIQNPFSITFTNASLSMTNSNSDNEAYMFTMSLDKTVIPTLPLTSDGSSTQCMYNATTFTAYLYTKKPSTLPSLPSPTTLSKPRSSSAATTSTTHTFKPWPFAVEITQSINSGESVPDCYKTNNGNLGEKIELQAVDQGERCSCDWKDF